MSCNCISVPRNEPDEMRNQIWSASRSLSSKHTLAGKQHENKVRYYNRLHSDQNKCLGILCDINRYNEMWSVGRCKIVKGVNCSE